MLLGDCVRETDIWTNLDKVNETENYIKNFRRLQRIT